MFPVRSVTYVPGLYPGSGLTSRCSWRAPRATVEEVRGDGVRATPAAERQVVGRSAAPGQATGGSSSHEYEGHP